MKRRLIIGLAIVVVIVAIVLGVLLGGGGGLAGEIEVPINAAGADDVGALHIELSYDPAVLQATGVDKGALAGNAMMEYNIYDDGWVVVSIVDSVGMNGDGSLAVVTFDVVGEDDDMTCDLMLANLKAWDATNVFGMVVESTPGSFEVSDRSFIAPIMVFNP